MSELEFLKHQYQTLRQILDAKLGLIGYLTSRLSNGVLHEMSLEEAQLELGRIENVFEERGFIRCKPTLSEEIDALIVASRSALHNESVALGEIPSDTP
jgi:hypothetical protein